MNKQDQLKKIKKEHCERKSDYKKRCERNGLKGTSLVNCVFDLCSGLPREVEKRIIKRDIKEEKKEIPIKRVTRPQCHLVADPHAYGFNGKNFEAQVEGDWILYKGLNMEAAYRGKRFAGQGWVANQKFGVQVYGQKIESINVGDVHNLIIDNEKKNN